MNEGFCIVDLWAAEAYVTALDANESGMLHMLDSGIKIHEWVEERIKEKFHRECIEANYGYKKAKQNVHSLNYGVQPPMMSRESGLPLYVSKWSYNFYHMTFPGIQSRMRRIEAELRTTHSLVSLLGRRRMFFAPWGTELFKEAYAWGSQSVIGEITNEALAKLYYFGLYSDPWVFPAIDTHDGLAIRYYLGEEEKVEKLVVDAFNIPITKWGKTIIIPVEVGWGSNFNDVKNKKVHYYDGTS